MSLTNAQREKLFVALRGRMDFPNPFDNKALDTIAAEDLDAIEGVVIELIQEQNRLAFQAILQVMAAK